MDALDADRIRGALDAGTAGWLRSLEVFESIDSTNAELMRRAATATVDGAVALAEHQSSGRGRRGRSWTTPRGRSIALSIGQRIETPAARLGPLSLVVGVAAATALERRGVPDVKLKWPNDLVLEERKLGGVLIEVVPLRQPTETVIGIGINVVRTAELDAVEAAVATIDDVLASPDRNALVALLISEVHAATERFASAGFGAFRDAWSARNLHAGRRVRVSSLAATVEGVVLGVAEQGELMLDTGSEVRLINAGEVSLREPS